jgi:hypothetical protein
MKVFQDLPLLAQDSRSRLDALATSFQEQCEHLGKLLHSSEVTELK